MDRVLGLIHEKIHVVLGNEVNGEEEEEEEEEGLLILSWILKNWASIYPYFTIIIFYIQPSSSYKDFVPTPFGKLPANAVSDEKLQILRKCEQEKIDSMLSKYANFCGKVKTEIHKIEKQDEQIQKIVVELIMEHRITKLVMGVTHMRSSSGRSKSAINVSFYVRRNKPEFCELYIVSRGKLVFLKEAENEEEGYMEDENGLILAKLKTRGSLRDWLVKWLSSSSAKSPVCPSSPGSSVDANSSSSRNHWENYEQQIDEYFQELKSRSNLEEEIVNNGLNLDSSIEQDILHSVMDPVDRLEALRKEIQVTQKMIEVNKSKANEVEGQAKAAWAICLCNHRVEELQLQINEEIATRTNVTKEIDNMKEELHEILTDVEESKNRLSSLLELQSELSAKLQLASLAKLDAETRLEKAANSRLDIVREIEELRRQKDVFQRRIEFCKEKDTIEMANRMTSSSSNSNSGDQVSCSYREFSADEIRLATDDFAYNRRLKSGGDWTNVYKGKINRLSVAIRKLESEDDMSQEIFQAKVNLLGNIRHPHIISLIGFCSNLKCLVFEYMHNGCLRDILFSRRKSKVLKWNYRVHIASQVSSGLGFLHLAQPSPIIHCGLSPSSISLDENFIAKIHALELSPYSDNTEVQANVCAFGNLLLQLLTGKNWIGLDQESTMTNKASILDALDDNAGDWPLDLAEEIVELALRCCSGFFEPENVGAVMSLVTEEVSKLKKAANDIVAKREYHMGSEEFLYSQEEFSHVPTIFLCPICQVVMENPHIAADGQSYELEAIEEWLGMGHDTSPVTNAKLNHKHLIPNKTLRFLIQDWHNTRKSHSSSELSLR